uniref:Zinc finger protein 593 homolog n=2 Tax=Ascaris TaxID=6251 RepID=A0A0M3I4Q2_ASCLU
MPKKHTTSNKTRKRKGKDMDQIAEDLKPEKAARLLKQEVDFDLPGDGQFYCIECDRYLVDEATMAKHKSSKRHRQRVKSLREVPYSYTEAEAAGGLGIYNAVASK